MTLFACKVTLSGGKVTHFPRKETLLAKFTLERVTSVNTTQVEA